MKQLDSCQTFKEIARVDGLTYWPSFDKDLDPYSYAFFQFDHKNGLVALRLTRKLELGPGQCTLFQLGLWVKPKKGMEKLFLQKSNFYMGKFFKY